jgi:hypothetical protein
LVVLAVATTARCASGRVLCARAAVGETATALASQLNELSPLPAISTRSMESSEVTIDRPGGRIGCVTRLKLSSIITPIVAGEYRAPWEASNVDGQVTSYRWGGWARDGAAVVPRQPCAGAARKSDQADYLIVNVSTDDASEARWGYCAATMNWDLRRRKSSLVIRLLLAVWITVVVVVLCATGRWWGLVFVVPLVLDVYLLRRILAAGSGR